MKIYCVLCFAIIFVNFLIFIWKIPLWSFFIYRWGFSSMGHHGVLWTWKSSWILAKQSRSIQSGQKISASRSKTKLWTKKSDAIGLSYFKRNGILDFKKGSLFKIIHILNKKIRFDLKHINKSLNCLWAPLLKVQNMKMLARKDRVSEKQ